MTTTRLCDETGCDQPRRANGLCVMHNKRFARKGTTLTDREHARLAEALDWIMDGDPLTSVAEREFHRSLAA